MAAKTQGKNYNVWSVQKQIRGYRRCVKHKAQGQNRPGKDSNLTSWNASVKVKQGVNFVTFNCVFIRLTTFPADEDLKVNKQKTIKCSCFCCL